jgi:hypothetical protein
MGQHQTESSHSGIARTESKGLVFNLLREIVPVGYQLNNPPPPISRIAAKWVCSFAGKSPVIAFRAPML